MVISRVYSRHFVGRRKRVQCARLPPRAFGSASPLRHRNLHSASNAMHWFSVSNHPSRPSICEFNQTSRGTYFVMKNKIEHSDLEAIASSIMEKHQKVESLIGSIQAKGREACLLAWETGGLLRKAKNELKGEFTAWRMTAIEGLATATTSRYLALANRITNRKDLEEHLDAGLSLTELYREVGILPEKEGQPKDDADGSTPPPPPGKKRGRQEFTAKVFLTALSSVAEKTTKLRKKAPVSQWSAEEREGFRKAFNALKEIDDEIAASERFNLNTLAEEAESMSGVERGAHSVEEAR